ncbi:MAG: plastocyanin/azurin family copper-binding protein [Acidimicrobiales bacterium]|jgi:plastocyanin|nr:plastocyanin/azurin family copper-binding protein [Acidimicrobiales bacterium]
MRVGARTSQVLVAGLLLVGVAGCSDDETASVEVLDGDATGSGSASGSASAPADAACSPVGEDLAADAVEVVDIGLVDFAFEPSTLSVEAGVVTFRAANEGNQNHELAFLPGGGDIPLTDAGDPDEDALAEAGAFELEAFGPGQTCDGTWDLAPGTYTLFCIVQTPDGQTHAELGMVGSLTVG